MLPAKRKVSFVFDAALKTPFMISSGALSPIHSVYNDLHSLTAKDSLLYFAADRLGHFGYERNEADPFVFRKLLIAEIFDFQLKLL